MSQRREIDFVRDLLGGGRKTPQRRGKDDDANGHLLREYRRELLLGVTLVIMVFWITALPRPLQLLIILAVAATFVRIHPEQWPEPDPRRWGWRLTGAFWRPLLNWLHRGRVKRDWAHALVDCGLDYPRGRRGAHIVRVRRTPAGDRLLVRLGRGLSTKTLDARAPELASSLHVDDVRVTKVQGDASHATVLLVRSDPFADYVHDAKGREMIRALPWPKRGESRLSLWDPILIGISEEGEPVTVTLPDHNLLLGGEPGAGKSVAINIICAAGVLDPDVHLWLFDGKVLELGPWSSSAERYVGPDVKEAIEAVQQLREIMDDRYRELKARGARKLQPDHGLPLYLVVVDELAFYLSTTNTKAKAQIRELFRDLVARGRAAGIIFVAATQKPDADTIPSALRDLIGYRLALRCNTWQHSDTILGQGRASAGTDASTIPGKQRGVGYLLAEGERPVRVRGYHLDDDEVEAVASRGFANRAEDELASLAGEGV